MQAFINGAVSASVLVALLTWLRMPTARTVEAKIVVGRRALLFLALASTIGAVGVLSAPATASGAEAVNDAFIRRAVAAGLAITAVALAVVWTVLRSVAAFVLEHRLDLAARDQVATRSTP